MLMSVYYSQRIQNTVNQSGMVPIAFKYSQLVWNATEWFFLTGQEGFQKIEDVHKWSKMELVNQLNFSKVHVELLSKIIEK